MAIRLVHEKWEDEFHAALKANTGDLCIISPFIKVKAIEPILERRPRRIRVITRFNLNDFAQGVSDTLALSKLLDAGAEVRGVFNLHTKLYILGKQQAVVTSANLTLAALNRNHELGVLAKEPKFVSSCLSYFDNLWDEAGSNLDTSKIKQWRKEVLDYQKTRKYNQVGDLKDHGTKIKGVTDVTTRVSVAPKSIVKLIGSDKNRKNYDPENKTTIDDLRGSGCQWSVAFKQNNSYLRSIQDGDLIYFGRMTCRPSNIIIFGYGFGMRHQPSRDIVKPEDIQQNEHKWRSEYKYNIQIQDAEFVNGLLKNGVSFKEYKDFWGYKGFASTLENKLRGEGNTKPNYAYLQKPSVILTPEGSQWLYDRLQQVFAKHGRIPKSDLDDLNRQKL